jgi:hypothetical protein
MKISLRNSGMARDLIPGAVGLVVAGGTALGLRLALDPTDVKSQTAYTWAPAIGAGVALLAAGVIYAIGGAGPAVATAIVGAGTGAAILGNDMFIGKKPGAAGTLALRYAPNQTTAALLGIANLAAVVPEYSNKLMGILWENAGMSGVDGGLGRNLQNRGEKVALHGVDSGKFGTRSYS